MVHVIKVYLEDPAIGKQQIRRLAVSSDVVNKFDLLHEKIKDLFPTIGKRFEVAWKDPEGDLVQMSSDPELAQALANAEDGLIKLYVCVIKTPEKKEEPKTTFNSHGNEVHPHTTCDGCNMSICGHRYKCLQCRDFDLCSACNAANKHPEHDMIKLVRPNYIPREWIFSGARAMWRSMFGHCARGFHHHNQPKEENESSSSKQQKSPNSPSEKWQEAFTNILGGDFVPAEKFFQESIQNMLKFAGVEVKIEKCPFSNGNSKNNENKAKMPEDEAQTESEKNSENTMSEKAKESPKQDDDGIRVTAKPEKKDHNVNSESVSFDGGLFSASSARPRENMEFSGIKVECDSTEDKEKETPISDASVLELSNGADGWTLLNKEETVKKEPLPAEHLTDNTIPKTSSSEAINAKVTEEKKPAPKDAKVADALLKMRAMGFTNEGGWLERLLITKHGSISDALDALYPNTLRN